MPEYHSIEEADQVRRGLENLIIYKDDGSISNQLKRPFTNNEKLWIRNERILCACDAKYWATRYAFIKDDKNQVIKFAFRKPQEIYFDVISELERREAAIELQICKSRQLGMSTVTELLICHRISFYSGVNAIIASARQQPTQIMSQMLFLAYDRMPFWLKPVWTRRVESDKGQLVFGGLESRVDFQHGAQKEGIGRGTTLTAIHLSEVASFNNAEELIEQGLFNAVHQSPSVFMVLESTAEGPTGWWADKWRHSRKSWGTGMARLCPLFLPWFTGVDLNPTPTWLKTHPVPEIFKTEPETREMMAKARAFVKSQEVLSKVLGENYEVPKEQVWYWQVKFLEAKNTGTTKSLYQEFPTDDIECFVSKYDSVFGKETIAEINTKRKKDYQVFGIVGPGIEPQHEPYREDVDYDREIRFARYKGTKDKSYSWQFIPLLSENIDEEDQETADLKLLIFHEPKPGVDYGIGVDTAGGKGRDSSAINVWAMGKGGLPDIQVAELASAYVSHLETFPFVTAIAGYYSQYMESPHREPLLAMEMLQAYGDSMVLQMRNMGYTRFYRFSRYDKKKLSKKDATQLGWMSTGWSRPILVDNFIHSIKNEIAVVNSPFLLNEMSTFEVHSTRGGREKLEHSEETHDDRLISAAIALHTYHEMHPLIERGKNRYVPQAEDKKPPLDISGYKSVVNPFKLSDAYFSERMKTPRQLEDFIENERFDRYNY